MEADGGSKKRLPADWWPHLKPRVPAKTTVNMTVITMVLPCRKSRVRHSSFNALAGEFLAFLASSAMACCLMRDKSKQQK